MIGRVIRVIDKSVRRISHDDELDPVLLDRMIDFVSMYAHRVHHGREEEILFRKLDDKALDDEHRQMMEELAREHLEMRRLTVNLRNAAAAYTEADAESPRQLAESLRALTRIYPPHMSTEEEQFFPVVSSYLSQKELEAILEEMRGLDRAMVHEKYGGLADELEGRPEPWDPLE